jgi:CrcB protein
MSLIWVMAGGALGAGGRFLLSVFMDSHTDGALPYGTLAANLIGCLAIGLLSALFSSTWQVSDAVRLGCIVGVLGGFTTFSSFGLETISLIQEGRLIAAAVYVTASNLGGLFAVWAGLKLAAY